MRPLYAEQRDIKYTPPPKFGDPLATKAYLSEVDQARKKQRAELAVAPRCDLQINGTLYRTGDDVPRDLLRPNEITRLVGEGVLLRCDARAPRPKSDYVFRGIPYVSPHTGHVARLDSLSIRGGVIEPGDYIRPEDLDVPPEPPRKYARSDGQIVEVPGHPGRDGKVKLAELVAKGYVERVSGSDPQPAKKKAS